MIKNKNQQYVGFMFILLIALTLVAGCGQSKKEILSQYRQSVQPILSELEQEGQKWDTLKSKNINGQISDVKFISIVQNELLPKMVQLQGQMEKVEPSKDLRAIHEIGIKMVSKNVQAMNEVVAILHNGDRSKITSANNLFTESRELERKYVNQLEDFLQ